jgi:heavy metal efflux system protein
VNIVIDRSKADRYGINVADVQDAVETAVGGKSVSQILKEERRYDLVVRYQPQYRNTIEQIGDIRLLAPSGERVALNQLSNIRVDDGASMIYRENNSRYVAIKYSVRGRDLGSTVEEAMQNVNRQVKLPEGYRLNWAGEYESQKRASKRLAIIIPITLLLIFLFLYTAFDSFKWSALVLLNVAMAPVGGVAALWLTGTHFSVSTGMGFLALFGVSVQIGLILIVCKSSTGRRALDSRLGAQRSCARIPADYDGDAGGYRRSAARRNVPWHRVGLAAAIRNCNRRGPDRRFAHLRAAAAHAICALCPRRRC